ncbi:MAG: hypothetical protein ACRDZ4_20645 [Egibacteraceae bacterium]
MRAARRSAGDHDFGWMTAFFDELFSLTGRVAMVTGGNSGIG